MLIREHHMLRYHTTVFETKRLLAGMQQEPKAPTLQLGIIELGSCLRCALEEIYVLRDDAHAFEDNTLLIFHS